VEAKTDCQGDTRCSGCTSSACFDRHHWTDVDDSLAAAASLGVDNARMMHIAVALLGAACSAAKEDGSSCMEDHILAAENMRRSRGHCPNWWNA